MARDRALELAIMIGDPLQRLRVVKIDCLHHGPIAVGMDLDVVVDVAARFPTW